MKITGKLGHIASILIALSIVVIGGIEAHADTFYVRTDGRNSNDGLTNSRDGAWETIDHAADSVSAGAVIRVQPGIYAERVTPGVNGTSETETVTFVADGDVTVCGFDIANGEYIRIIGFTIDSDAGSCSQSNGCVILSGTSSHLEFWHNTMRDGRYNGIRVGGNGTYDNSVIIGNKLSNFGIGNGSGMAVSTVGNHNLIAYNEVYNSHPDGFLMRGKENRWLNNYAHDLSEASGGHADIFQTGSHDIGWAGNLIEATLQHGMGNMGHEHSAQISHAQPNYCNGPCGEMTENIFRRNVWHNVSNGTIGINQTNTGPITFTRYYHNTIAEACENSSNTRYGMAWYGPNTSDSYIFNNIEYESWGNGATNRLEVYYVTGGLAADYNLAFDPDGSVNFASPWTSQSHAQSNADPDFNDYEADDFTLGEDSQATGNAGNLTTTNGSGTGLTFQVANEGSGFFRGDDPHISQYDGGLVVGDLITVGDDTVRIDSISGNDITVTESFTWEHGEPVYFGDDATPDIGAYPYKAGGYALSAVYAITDGTVTVTPNDADLVRMVVVFEDGIPVGADAVPPYVVSSVNGGDLDVRVYPRYAGETLYVAAEAEGPGTRPAAPTDLLIVD